MAVEPGWLDRLLMAVAHRNRRHGFKWLKPDWPLSSAWKDSIRLSREPPERPFLDGMT
jgi:hypothetical protein